MSIGIKFPNKAFLNLCKEVKPYRLYILIGGVMALLSSLLDASVALAIKHLIDDYNASQLMSMLTWVPGLVLVFFILRGTLNFLSKYAIAYAGRSVIADLRLKLFHHLLRLPKSFHDVNSSSSLLSKIIYNVEQVAQTSSNVLISFLKDSSMILALLMSMIVISWKFMLTLLCCVPFVYLVMKFGSLKTRLYGHRLQNSMSNTSEHAIEVLNRIELVKVHQAENFETSKMSGLLDKNRSLELKASAVSALTSSLVQLFLSMPVALIAFLIVNRYLDVTPGSCAAFLAILLQITRPLRGLTEVNAELQKGLAGAESIFSLMGQSTERADSRLSQPIHCIDIKNLSFVYSDESVALRNINLTFSQGEKVIIVGPSGSGKSSLLKVLAGYYLEDITGEFQINHHRLDKGDSNLIRDQLAYASQNHSEISATISENISYSDKENIEKIQEVLNAVNLSNEIDSLGGSDALIGDMHQKKLSGGQRQRLSLARALYSDSVSLMILDEVTSALDRKNQTQVWQSIFNLVDDKILICSLHHVEMFEKFDRVVFINEGRVIADGPHGELIESCQDYMSFCGGLKNDQSMD